MRRLSSILVRAGSVLVVVALALSIGACTRTAQSSVAGPRPPAALSEQDAQQFKTLARNYAIAILSGKRNAAISLFLPRTRKSAEAAVSRDMGIARDDRQAFAFQGVRLLWLTEGQLLPPGNDDQIMQSEAERLRDLTATHDAASMVIIDRGSGDRTKLYAVRDGGTYGLLP